MQKKLHSGFNGSDLKELASIPFEIIKKKQFCGNFMGNRSFLIRANSRFCNDLEKCFLIDPRETHFKPLDAILTKWLNTLANNSSA